MTVYIVMHSEVGEGDTVAEVYGSRAGAIAAIEGSRDERLSETHWASKGGWKRWRFHTWIEEREVRQ